MSSRSAAIDLRKSGRRELPGREFLGKTFLGRYEVVSFLGEGSNAHVLLARPLARPDQFVVVKRIKDHIVNTPRFRQFFDNEVKSMARFSHPYALRMHDASLDDPLGPCLVLDYIPGITLDQLLAKHRRFPVERTARLILPLLHALQAAHAAGIVHRDLKPANLMVVNAGTAHESVRVLDFGFAGFSAKPHIQLAELTGHGPIFACGTPAYVSPEMIRGDAVDGRADLYAVGVMLYELLTGRLPFDVQSTEEMLAAHVRISPPRFGRIGVGDVPAAIEAIVHHALAKFPNERPQTAHEMADQFSRAFSVDVWAATAPVGYVPPTPREEEIVECTLADQPAKPGTPEDKFVLFDQFEALLPERLAALKLRAFIEEVGGVAVASEPGLIRVRLELPPGWKDPTPNQSKGSGLFNWLSAARGRGLPRARSRSKSTSKCKRVTRTRFRFTSHSAPSSGTSRTISPSGTAGATRCTRSCAGT
ncbi:serine/threonine-protein kinase [Fimbriiglobus ruber]|uniref:Serine/threonine-protein kinase PknB n=1 Tax=Fimbriiglobus ruber TaxID=1908690 RepID=A0A225E0X5_9BACT|nr:serine/threonine-protein kinase [Fimbriiglobus ruber]OWK42345.1 Serine/threonine-protein kinase PknB [Fimbriiglobus ruber]